MAQKIITIVGVTGQQGSSVAEVFLKEGGWKVRGITRDASKPAAKAWADQGVELIAADLDDVESLKKAFAGSNVIFGVTDFWGNLGGQTVQAEVQKSGRPINVVGYDVEVQQGRNIVDAANATIGTLDRFVLSTLSPTKELSKGKYTHNFHFDAKWQAALHLKSTYPELWKKSSLLQVGLYMSNWKGSVLMQPRKEAEGKYVLSMPLDGDSPVAMVSARGDTGSFTKALVDAPAGKNLLGYGSLISYGEWTTLWARIHGVEGRYERLDRKIVEGAIPVIGEELADMFEYISDFGYHGGDPSVIFPKDLGFPVKVTTAEEYIKSEDWSAVLSPPAAA